MIAFGGNLGDRIGHIERALQKLNRRQVRVKRVSALYETAPMYVTDGVSDYLNGVCEVGHILTIVFVFQV